MLSIERREWRNQIMEHEDGLISAAKARKTADDMWDTAYRQEKKYGSFDTSEPDWDLDIESKDFD